MENKKQTAVEWLIDELTRLGHNFNLYKIELNKAKEMEKEQIQDLQTKIEDLTAENEQYERELNGKIKNIKCPNCKGDSWKYNNNWNNSCGTDDVKYCKCGASFYI